MLDTTVLVDAKGATHPLRDPCRELLRAIADGRLDATATVEVIQEFAHVRTQRRGRADAAGLAAPYAELLSPLLGVTSEDLRAGLGLFERVGALGAFDAGLAAARLGAADALVSADRAFARIPGLTHVVPDAARLQSLLGQPA